MAPSSLLQNDPLGLIWNVLFPFAVLLGQRSLQRERSHSSLGSELTCSLPGAAEVTFSPGGPGAGGLEEHQEVGGLGGQGPRPRTQKRWPSWKHRPGLAAAPPAPPSRTGGFRNRPPPSFVAVTAHPHRGRCSGQDREPRWLCEGLSRPSAHLTAEAPAAGEEAGDL